MSLAVAVNQILGPATIGAEALALLLLVFLVARKPAFVGAIGKHGIALAFLVALLSTLGSLIYSDVIGYEPCKLCWFQRIFMYPQVLILGIGLLKKDARAADYALVLSFLGAIVAGYHYLLQIGVAPAIPCAAIGDSVSCSQRFVLEYDYITIPMMALSAFILIAALLFTYKKFNPIR